MGSDPTLRGQPIEMISVNRFLCSARSNLAPYPKMLSFWWPIIETRACHHLDSAGPLLLNPIFRWAFLARRDKLDVLESNLDSFEAAVGSRDFQAFRDQSCADVRGIDIENRAHNRLLSVWTEIRAVLRFSSEGEGVSLVPRRPGRRTPDLRVDGRGDLEVKYVRPPDKLGEYLLRWWRAQKQVGGQLPPELRLYPQRDDWQRLEERDELSASEIDLLRAFLTEVLLQPAEERSVGSGRLSVSYRSDRQLLPSTTPLPKRAVQSESDREPLFNKLRTILTHAATQAAGRKGRTVFLFLNLSPDIDFLWPKGFAERMEALREEFAQNGLDVLIERVGYL